MPVKLTVATHNALQVAGQRRKDRRLCLAAVALLTRRRATCLEALHPTASLR